MKCSPKMIVVMLALVALLSACNPLWEAPPIERLRAGPSATITDTAVSERPANTSHGRAESVGTPHVFPSPGVAPTHLQTHD